MRPVQSSKAASLSVILYLSLVAFAGLTLATTVLPPSYVLSWGSLLTPA